MQKLAERSNPREPPAQEKLLGVYYLIIEQKIGQDRNLTPKSLLSPIFQSTPDHHQTVDQPQPTDFAASLVSTTPLVRVDQPKNVQSSRAAAHHQNQQARNSPNQDTTERYLVWKTPSRNDPKNARKWAKW
jgi:hypothetical protein